jgi:hypothetical protein
MGNQQSNDNNIVVEYFDNNIVRKLQNILEKRKDEPTMKLEARGYVINSGEVIPKIINIRPKMDINSLLLSLNSTFKDARIRLNSFIQRMRHRSTVNTAQRYTTNSREGYIEAVRLWEKWRYNYPLRIVEIRQVGHDKTFNENDIWDIVHPSKFPDISDFSCRSYRRDKYNCLKNHCMWREGYSMNGGDNTPGSDGEPGCDDNPKRLLADTVRHKKKKSRLNIKKPRGEVSGIIMNTKVDELRKYAKKNRVERESSRGYRKPSRLYRFKIQNDIFENCILQSKTSRKPKKKVKKKTSRKPKKKVKKKTSRKPKKKTSRKPKKKTSRKPKKKSKKKSKK